MLNVGSLLFASEHPPTFHPPSLRRGAPIGQALPVLLFRSVRGAPPASPGEAGARPRRVSDALVASDPACSGLCQNRAHGIHLVRADVRPPARQGRGRGRGSVPVGGRADRPRDHRRHRHLQPPRRRPLPKAKGKPSRDGKSVLPSSLDDAFVLDGPGEYEVKEVLVTGVRTYRDDARGRRSAASRPRSSSSSTAMHTIHLGDIGHLLSEEKLGDIGSVDIACVPVGGSLIADQGRGAHRPARPEDRRADADLRRRRRLRRGARRASSTRWAREPTDRSPS